MMPDWSPLRQALSACRSNGMRLPVWWRDDDAVDPSVALDKLETQAQKLNVQVLLAVVPRHTSPALAARIAQTDTFKVLVHGWAHANHASPKTKKSEFGAPREDARGELIKGIHTIRELFGQDALPVFVPPWNRMDDCYLNILATAGYRALSTFAPRNHARPHPKLAQINCHIDPIDWRGTRELLEPDQIIATTVSRIEARLADREDPDEPLGFLTHHLVHTPDIWEFSSGFLQELLDGGAEAQPLSPLLELSK